MFVYAITVKLRCLFVYAIICTGEEEVLRGVSKALDITTCVRLCNTCGEGRHKPANHQPQTSM